MLSHLRSLLIRSKSSQLFPLRLTVETEPPKLTFGHACYVFERVAPHPNCPPNGVLRRSKCSYTPRTVSLCVAPPRTGVPGIDASRLLSTWSATAQRQAAVKLYGVFACRLRLLDCAPVIVNFAGRTAETVGLSLGHSCKSPIKRQGITLP